MTQLHLAVSFVLRSVWFVTWILLSLSLLSMQRAQAQDFPRIEVFGGYSILRPNIPSDLGGSGSEGVAVERVGEFLLGNMLGWGAGVTVNLNRTLGITADFSGHYRSLDVTVEDTHVDANGKLYTFLFGPKVTFGGETWKPSVHALFGIGRATASFTADFDGDSESGDFKKNGFAAAVGGGLDAVVHPNVAVRVIELDYFPVRNGDGKTLTFNNVRWQSGVVIRF